MSFFSFGNRSSLPASRASSSSRSAKFSSREMIPGISCSLAIQSSAICWYKSELLKESIKKLVALDYYKQHPCSENLNLLMLHFWATFGQNWATSCCIICLVRILWTAPLSTALSLIMFSLRPIHTGSIFHCGLQQTISYYMQRYDFFYLCIALQSAHCSLSFSRDKKCSRLVRHNGRHHLKKMSCI